MYNINRKQSRYIIILGILATLFILPSVSANEVETQPSPNLIDYDNLLTNTPLLTNVDALQDDAVASINWADYVGGESIKNNFNPLSMARLLLNTTPRTGYLSSHWEDYVASINWADYAD